MIPFTIAILRYAVDVDGGLAGEPEEIALKDRVLQLLAAGVDRNHRCRSLPQLSGVTAADRPTRSAQLARWPAFPYDVTVRISLWVSVLVVAALFGWGAWQRRWIADDGLIVLRTVRNLLAGNGPVFNEGERVEANTSTVWTYLVYLGALVGGSVRLEYVGARRWHWCSACRAWCSRCWAPAGCTRRACGAGGRCCCPRVCWSTSRYRPPATSPPRDSKTVWCWPISACCGG